MTTVTDLVIDIKNKLKELHVVVSAIHERYNAAADIIDSNTDWRVKHLEQLQELHKTITTLVDTHPAHVDKLSQDVLKTMVRVTEQYVNQYDNKESVQLS